MKPFKIITTATIICAFTQLPICTFAQVVNGTGAGNCLSFNGTSNYVDEGNINLFNNTSQFTISAWIYINSFPGDHGGIVTKRVPFNATSGVAFNLTSFGYLELHVRNGANTGAYAQTVILPKNTYIHVTAVYDGSQANNADRIKIYTNGILLPVLQQGTIPNTTSTINTNVLFGVDPEQGIPGAGDDVFNGKIDEVRVWNRALTQDEIRANMCKKLQGTESGLVGYWRFDEGSGSTVYDASPNGNNGTLH